MAKIVVFGANSAVAQACNRYWAEQGHDLFLVGRDPKKLQAQVMDLKVRTQGRVESMTADLSHTSEHAAIYNEILSKFDKIDTIFIAHGLLGQQDIAERDFDRAQEILRVNLLSPVSLLTHGAQILEAAGGGSLAAITSVAGDRGRKSNYVYGMSKGALSIFLSGLRHRLAEKSISVTDIRMGFVDTPMTQEFKKGLLWQSPENVAKAIVRSIDRKRGITYAPRFWRLIMFVIKSIPEFIFKKMSI